MWQIGHATGATPDVRMKAGNQPSGFNQEADLDDAALFREAMRGVKPLQTSARVEHERPKPRPVPRPKRAASSVLEDTLSDHYAFEMAEEGEWSFARPGLQRQGLRRLRSGYWYVQAELDLHGLTREAARRKLVWFLERCAQQGYQCVRIIHGRGHGSKDRQPVLKTLIGGWLAQCEAVLAFCQARQVDGGSGAMMVLLKKG